MGDLTEVLMPQLGETVTEGTILQWFKAPGDEVAEDDELFEVSTDKVDTTVPSAVAGVLTTIFVEAGDTVAVGERLAAIDTGGTASAGGDGSTGRDTSDGGDPPATTTPATTPSRPDVAAPTPAGTTAATVASAPASAAAPARSAVALAERPPGDGSPRAFLSPAVRRLLDEHHLDAAGIRGTGAGGRVTRDDVRREVEGRAAGDRRGSDGGDGGNGAPAVAGASTAVDSPSVGPARAEGDEVITFSPLRRRIAEHMTRSLHTSAHTLVVMEVDYAAVAAVRDERKAAFKEREGVGLTYLPFIARAVVRAIARYPQVNGSVDGDQLIVHRAVNLGVAVDLDFAGLIVPVLKHAEVLGLRDLAIELAGQATRARERTLAADDVAGGTFTITNAGSYGTLLTAPIINQPQVAILSTDGVKMKPVAVALDDGTYGVAVHPVGNLALSFDHRAFDGAYASAFLAQVVRELEEHDWVAEANRPDHPDRPDDPGDPDHPDDADDADDQGGAQ